MGRKKKEEMRLYTTGEFADLFRVTRQTVGAWERKGIIRPYGHEVSGRKLFSHQQYLDMLGLDADPGRVIWREEFATLLGVDVDAVNNMIYTGKLSPHRTKTGLVFFTESQLPESAIGTESSEALILPTKAARSLGISADALRIWDKIGKFRGTRTADGRLAYTPEQIRKLAKMLGNGSLAA